MEFIYSVFIGLCLTIGALTYGLFNFYHQRRMMQQYSMRARVFFQGVTLAALTFSMYNEGQRRIQRYEEGKAEEKANEKSNEKVNEKANEKS